MDDCQFNLLDIDDFPDEWDTGSKETKEDKTGIDNDGPEIDGLDLATVGEWIYPTNYPVRDYQKNIVTKALFNNTLVCLPTGLGKTFIAAVVMYNYNRWYPHHKIVFMAHSKPLVAQQLEACCQIMGIQQHVTAHLNGNISAQIRKQHWETKSIFFLTPQVFNNDLTRGLVTASSIRCVVVDEAHKALGNQAFCQAIRSLQPFNKSFRVLALSATPGDDVPTVKSVIENLLISKLELRTEEDPDIQKYLHTKRVEAIPVSLDAKIIEFKDRLLHVAEKYLRQLSLAKAIGGSFGSLTSFSLVLKHKQFIANPSVSANQRGIVLSNFSVVISLYKSLEELIIHGLRSFHSKLLVLQSGEGAKSNTHCRLAKDQDFLSLIEAVESYIGKDTDVAFDPDLSMARLQDELDAQVIGQRPPIVYSHPKFAKLEEIVVKHFQDWTDKENSTKVIVFCKSRPCTGEICNFLNRFRPLVKPMVLIGQSNTSGGSTARGLKQSAQLEVMRKFRAGLYNTLVATSVGEEGLDVGEVDLIINFDSSRNSNTQVQRSGRTGRKRDGRVVNLVTEGKEYQDYNVSLSKSKAMTKKLSKGVQNLPLYPDSPRLLPKNVKPVCQEMFLKAAPMSAEKSKPDNVVNKPGEKKKRNPKKTKKNDEPVSSPASNQKYDIRYAMTKARIKPKLAAGSDEDTSDSLFESGRAVDIFKGSAKKPNIKPVEDIANDVMVVDEIAGSNFRDQCKTFCEIIAKPLDEQACDFLNKLSIEELVMLADKHGEKIEFSSGRDLAKYSDFAFNEDSAESDADFQDVIVTSPANKNDIPVLGLQNDRNESDFPLNETVRTEDTSKKNESMLTFTQAIAKINIYNPQEPPAGKTPDINQSSVENKPSLQKTEDKVSENPKRYRLSISTTKNLPAEEMTSPSLIYSQKTRHFNDSKVKKSLIFSEPQPAKKEAENLSVIDLGSDDDLFANDERERELIFSQRAQQTQGNTAQPETRSVATKTAVVRPMGFESLHASHFDDSEWLTTDDKPDKSILSFTGKREPMKGSKQKSLLQFVTVKEKPKETPPANMTFPSFDCAPEELDDFFDSSPFKIHPPASPANPSRPPLKQSTPLVRNKAEVEGYLSDGALEAIQAVEEFEIRQASQQPATTKPDIPVFDLWDDDDDKDFVGKSIVPAKRSKTVKPKLKKSCSSKAKNVFIDEQADLSGKETSDDEDTSGLDEMDSSFLDERVTLTQAPGVDMTAQYLKTTKSPKGLMGRFKIPENVPCNFEVFSQLDVNDEDYAQDSFCVDDGSEESNEELSLLEIAEMKLEKRNKRKRSPVKSAKKSPLLGKVKRRRIILQDSSSDDEIAVIPTTDPVKNSKHSSPEPIVKFDPSVPPLVFIGSRQIASAPEITIALRAKFNFRVDVRSCPGADFIVSCRMGINRISLSDFCNGSPAIRSSLKESATKLRELFTKPVIIIEDSKTLSAPRTSGCYREMWSKHSAKRLVRLYQANITTLFSRNKDDTAEMIARLTKSECAKGNGVVTDWTDFPPSLESRLKFYTSLPGVNVALALKMCRKFSTLSTFLSLCHSITDVVRIMEVSESVAAKIYIALLAY